MKQDLVLAEVYQANGFTVYHMMPITEATGTFYTREDFGHFPSYFDYVYGTKLDLNQGNDVLHISASTGMGEPLLVVRVDVAAVVAYLNKQLPSTKSAPVSYTDQQVQNLLYGSPYLFRNFGFSYNRNKQGLVRIKQTVAPKKVKAPYTKTWFNEVRREMLRHGLLNLQTTFKISKMDRLLGTSNNDANNVAVFLKKHIPDPLAIQYTEYRYGGYGGHDVIVVPVTFDEFLKGYLIHSAHDADVVIPMVRQELLTWWDNVTEVK